MPSRARVEGSGTTVSVSVAETVPGRRETSLKQEIGKRHTVAQRIDGIEFYPINTERKVVFNARLDQLII
jgi:hypothetical protein